MLKILLILHIQTHCKIYDCFILQIYNIQPNLYMNKYNKLKYMQQNNNEEHNLL